jgi:membrane-associated HD superfamily phosphohydrolase
MEKTLLYHYTSLSHLIEIFKVGKVLTSQTEKMLKVKKPGLWFSTNNKWEYSAFKRFNDGNKEFDLNTPEEFEKYIGCARLVTNLNSLFVTFAKYKHKSKVNPMLWEKMAEIGKSKGADPTEWYATFSPMSINNLDIDVYENGEWHSLKKGEGEFDSELFNRNLEKTFVFKKGKEMEEKMMNEVAKQKENIEQKAQEVVEEKVEEVVEEKVEEVVEEKVEEVVEEKVEEVVEEKVEEVIEEKVEEVVEEKVEEVVEEKVEEVVEEKVEDEKPKSKGIFSRVKSLFKRK